MKSLGYGKSSLSSCIAAFKKVHADKFGDVAESAIPSLLAQALYMDPAVAVR